MSPPIATERVPPDLATDPGGGVLEPLPHAAAARAAAASNEARRLISSPFILFALSRCTRLSSWATTSGSLVSSVRFCRRRLDGSLQVPPPYIKSGHRRSPDLTAGP